VPKYTVSRQVARYVEFVNNAHTEELPEENVQQFHLVNNEFVTLGPNVLALQV